MDLTIEQLQDLLTLAWSGRWGYGYGLAEGRRRPTGRRNAHTRALAEDCKAAIATDGRMRLGAIKVAYERLVEYREKVGEP